MVKLNTDFRKLTTKDRYIEQFFIQDGEELQSGLIRRSVLLALIEDLKYCLQFPKKFIDVGLSMEQVGPLEMITPTFTVCALFFMGVDVLGRVLNRRMPNRNEGKSFFSETMLSLYDADPSEIKPLWTLRNDIIHSYKISDRCWITAGGKKYIEKLPEEGRWHFCLRPMLGATQEAAKQLYNLTISQNNVQRMTVAMYLQYKGFFVTGKPTQKIK